MTNQGAQAQLMAVSDFSKCSDVVAALMNFCENDNFCAIVKIEIHKEDYKKELRRHGSKVCLSSTITTISKNNTMSLVNLLFYNYYQVYYFECCHLKKKMEKLLQILFDDEITTEELDDFTSKSDKKLMLVITDKRWLIKIFMESF